MDLKWVANQLATECSVTIASVRVAKKALTNGQSFPGMNAQMARIFAGYVLARNPVVIMSQTNMDAGLRFSAPNIRSVSISRS